MQQLAHVMLEAVLEVLVLCVRFFSREIHVLVDFGIEALYVDTDCLYFGSRKVDLFKAAGASNAIKLGRTSPEHLDCITQTLFVVLLLDQCLDGFLCNL